MHIYWSYFDLAHDSLLQFCSVIENENENLLVIWVQSQYMVDIYVII